MEELIFTIQKYLENNPLLLIGSGSSVAYGLPTMKDLTKEIVNNKSILSDDEVVEALIEDLNKDMNLEEAISLHHQILVEDYNKIKRIVWQMVNKKDQEFFLELLNGVKDFPLKELLYKLVSTANKTVNIITTNYDRIIEYAADIVEATIDTGFVGEYFKTFEITKKQIKNKRIKSRERVIYLCKVHGSLDWVRMKNNFYSITGLTNIPNDCEPNIITPGPQKYMEAYSEPYREIIQEADCLINQANCFLAIGYGFNDNHIQPRIIEEIKKGKPIVIITKKATEQCKQILKSSHNIKSILIEELDNESKVTINGKEEKINGSLWKLEELLKIW